MSLPHEYFAYLAGLTALLAVVSIWGPKRWRQRAAEQTVVLMTLFAASYVFVSYSENKLGKTNGVVAADQAEMQLRVLSIIHAGLAQFNESVGLPAPTKSDLSAETKAKQEALKRAQDALTLAIEQNPSSYRLKAKSVLILGLENPQENAAKIQNLCQELQSQHATDRSARQAASIGAVLSDIFAGKPIASQAVDTDAAIIRQVFARGWYTNEALLLLYKAAGATDLLKGQLAATQSKYAASCVKIVTAAIVIGTCGLIGIITLLFQAAAISRTVRPSIAQEEASQSVGLALPLKTIYTVFIAWFSVQIAVSLCFHALLEHSSYLATIPLAVALSTALTYLCANISGPLLIYFLALKPAGLDFWTSLKMRWRTSTASPAKLVAAGFLGVCSTIPLIFTCVLLTRVQGSDNPVLGQIMQASTASSVPATLIFYFTLGVMAPFFEEILFRGFIYAGLKVHFGAAPALVASSVLFAVMHFDKGGLLLLTIIGLVLGYIFERTRSLVPSMICHGLWNSGSFTLALLVFSA